MNPVVSNWDIENDFLWTGLSSNPSDGTVIRFEPATVSISENTAENFRIYPNPFSDQLSVVLPSGKATKFTVFNSLGTVALTGKLETKESKLDLSKLSSGIYILQIGAHQKKIIKQ